MHLKKRVNHIRSRWGLVSLLLLSLMVTMPVSPAEESTVEAVYTGDPDSTIFYDYEQLVNRLHHIESVSGGQVRLEVIGKSNQGRDIYLATAGTGDIPVMIVTQQHGDEPHGTQSVLDLLEDLGTAHDPVALNILERLTVYIVPRLNPDGSEPGVFTYYNVDPDAPVSYGEGDRPCQYRVGWNLNRFHVADWESHILSSYEEFALSTDHLGFVLGSTVTGSADHTGEEGLLIDCGKGLAPEDFPVEAAGNIALIEQGEGTFDEKSHNAETAGAIGSVFYPDDTAGEVLPRWELSAPPSIPVLSIPRDRALEIMEYDGPVTAEIITHTYPDNPVTEAALFMERVLSIEPLWLVDVHNQRSFISPAGRTVTSSLFWGVYGETEVIELGQQLSAVMSEHMDQFDYAEITLFPGTSARDIARNAYSSLGVATVLLELWNNHTNPEIAEILIEHGYEQLFAALKKTADGTLFDLDPTRAFIQDRGERVSLGTAEDVFRRSVLEAEKGDQAGEDELPATGGIIKPWFMVAVALIITAFFLRYKKVSA